MTRWFVAMSPLASTTNPDAWVVGVQRATTLSCHWVKSDDGSPSTGRRRPSRRWRLHLRVVGGQLEDRVAAGGDVDHLRPLIRLALERDRLVRLHRVVPRPQPHVGGAIQRRDDPPGRRAWRVVADEQRMARHRRRLPFGVDQDDLDTKDAGRLDGSRARADRERASRGSARGASRHRRPVSIGCQRTPFPGLGPHER